MKFNLETNTGAYSIKSYKKGEIVIRLPLNDREFLDSHNAEADGTLPIPQETIHTSLIISPKSLIRNWEPQSFDELGTSHFKVILESQPEIVLLGTGSSIRWPDIEISAYFMQQNIGFEVMDTAAACRTYNVLLGDGRNVSAAILPI